MTRTVPMSQQSDMTHLTREDVTSWSQGCDHPLQLLTKPDLTCDLTQPWPHHLPKVRQSSAASRREEQTRLLARACDWGLLQNGQSTIPAQDKSGLQGLASWAEMPHDDAEGRLTQEHEENFCC